jgi:hypothetical protein
MSGDDTLGTTWSMIEDARIAAKISMTSVRVST